MLPNYTDVDFVYESKDYDAFKFIGFNRKIDWKHVQRLEEEIIKGAEMTPGIVCIEQDEMFIIDHQHTFMACKNQKIPFRFVMRTKQITIADLAAMNSKVKKWTIDNFIYAWEKSGCKGFTILYDFMRRYEMSTDIALSILHIDTSAKSGLPSIQDGSLHKRLLSIDWNEVHSRVCNILDIQSRWIPAGKKKSIKTKAFTRACIRLIEHKDYNHKTMLNKLNVQKIASKYPIKSCSANDYRQYLEDFYNHNLSEKNRIKI